MLGVLLLMAAVGTSGGCAVAGWISDCETSVVNGAAVEIHGQAHSRGIYSTAEGSSSGSIPESAAQQDCGALNRCDNFTVSLLPQATLADVASFAPAPVALSGEPAGHGVVGLPTNFVVEATEHSATGMLFDLPVTVRFSPESVVVSTGDGATVSSATGGGSWTDLGLAQFSPTGTSHTYLARGRYVASAVVHYRAEVDFGRGWRPVAGLLRVPTADYPIDVLEARGALVERTCAESPAAPGC